MLTPHNGGQPGPHGAPASLLDVTLTVGKVALLPTPSGAWGLLAEGWRLAGSCAARCVCPTRCRR